MRALLAAVLACCACAPRVYTRGVLNLEVVDPHLLRGGEPTAEGWRYLEQSMHVCAVIQLDYDDERPRGVTPPPGLTVFPFSMPPNDLDDVWRAPTLGFMVDAVRFAETLASELPDGCVLYVHCKNGWDRTGAFVAFWRVLVDGWDKATAWAEAIRLGLHEHVWLGLVKLWSQLA